MTLQLVSGRGGGIVSRTAFLGCAAGQRGVNSCNDEVS
jgi:hypothetical protein